MNEAELLKALAAAHAPTANDDPGMTVREMATAVYGSDSAYNRQRVGERLRPLLAAGQVRGGRRQVMQNNGCARRAPVYAVVKR